MCGTGTEQVWYDAGLFGHVIIHQEPFHISFQHITVILCHMVLVI